MPGHVQVHRYGVVRGEHHAAFIDRGPLALVLGVGHGEFHAVALPVLAVIHPHVAGQAGQGVRVIADVVDQLRVGVGAHPLEEGDHLALHLQLNGAAAGGLVGRDLPPPGPGGGIKVQVGQEHIVLPLLHRLQGNPRLRLPQLDIRVLPLHRAGIFPQLHVAVQPGGLHHLIGVHHRRGGGAQAHRLGGLALFRLAVSVHGHRPGVAQRPRARQQQQTGQGAAYRSLCPHMPSYLFQTSQ